MNVVSVDDDRLQNPIEPNLDMMQECVQKRDHHLKIWYVLNVAKADIDTVQAEFA